MRGSTRDARVYDTVEDDSGKPKRVLNKKETMLAGQKQQAIKDAFANWVWQDPQRREVLVRQYNELFNSTRPREYDGSHIHFVGMNPEIALREHQRNAIAHVLYGGNTLLAHEVGAGKTFEMAASAMEAKRLGLCQSTPAQSSWWHPKRILKPPTERSSAPASPLGITMRSSLGTRNSRRYRFHLSGRSASSRNRSTRSKAALPS